MSLVKPGLQTRFHIDFSWWQQNETDWRVHLRGLLCPEHAPFFADGSIQAIDIVDPHSAEVQSMDGLQYTLLSHCALQSGFVTAKTQLVEAIFRTFLANGNQPLSPNELSERLNRPASTILITISGPRVYRGLRPARQ